MEGKTGDLIERIKEGLANLKERTDCNVLRFKDQLWIIEEAFSRFEKTGNQDARNHLIDLFMKTNSASLEGEPAFDSSIWNANIQAKGKMTTLGDLLWELKDLTGEKAN